MSYHCVPLYDSLGENAVEYIVNHSEAAAVFVDAAKLAAFAKALPSINAACRLVIVWGDASSGAAEGALAAVRAARNGALSVVFLPELLQQGASAPADPSPPKPEDLCTIMYTSGTTGDPKGVELTHAAVVATIASLTSYLRIVGVSLGPGDSMLSYLPLAHIFDRVAEEMFLYTGSAVGYWQGDAAKLVEDIGALRPTLFIGVPRVFDRIYAGISSQISSSSPLKKLIFGYAFARKLSFIQSGVAQDKASPLFDKIVFSKIKQRLGGRVRIIVSGGAPLAPHVEEFLKVAMCAPVVQGYGLTETCAASCIAMPDTWEHAATVGPVLPCTELRLESVPEMGYDATDAKRPGGEVLLRGPQLFTGYYKMPDKVRPWRVRGAIARGFFFRRFALPRPSVSRPCPEKKQNTKQTAECLDDDGWFHTGDIGILTPEGALKIVDRKKNIFKLSQGGLQKCGGKKTAARVAHPPLLPRKNPQPNQKNPPQASTSRSRSSRPPSKRPPLWSRCGCTATASSRSSSPSSSRSPRRSRPGPRRATSPLPPLPPKFARTPGPWRGPSRPSPPPERATN
jgi:long-chain acyl-CoA synthetase